jgi:hypothetical protein
VREHKLDKLPGRQSRLALELHFIGRLVHHAHLAANTHAAR